MKNELEKLYEKLNKREFVHPDPLEFLYNFSEKKDIEIVGIIASSLAYGKVTQILKSVKIILEFISPSPSDFILNSNMENWKKLFKNFKHRFTKGPDVVSLLLTLKKILKKHSSVENAFKNHFKINDENIIPALSGFVKEMNYHAEKNLGHLTPAPEKGSACKRLMLFLRWMIRSDEIDLGLWDISASKLVIPLDSHMHYISSGLGFTTRKSADMKTAIQITDYFKKISLDDPVKYDFALTRLGIRNELDRDEFINKMNRVDRTSK